MARSHKIYVVKDASGILACFTVKHECKTYLKKFTDDELETMWVVSYLDGDTSRSFLIWEDLTGQELWQ